MNSEEYRAEYATGRKYFVGEQLEGNFYKAKLEGDFYGAKLKGDFHGATLEGDFCGAILDGDFYRAMFNINHFIAGKNLRYGTSTQYLKTLLTMCRWREEGRDFDVTFDLVENEKHLLKEVKVFSEEWLKWTSALQVIYDNMIAHPYVEAS